jgi:hypothetical protein
LDFDGSSHTGLFALLLLLLLLLPLRRVRRPGASRAF